VRQRTLPLGGRSSILLDVEYPFPPVGIVGAADGKNRRAFLFLARSCIGVRPVSSKSSTLISVSRPCSETEPSSLTLRPTAPALCKSRVHASGALWRRLLYRRVQTRWGAVYIFFECLKHPQHHLINCSSKNPVICGRNPPRC
jgi:hypothetical protein